MATLTKDTPASKTQRATHRAVGETVGVRVGGTVRSGRVIETRRYGKGWIVKVEMITAAPEDALVLELPERWVTEPA